MSGWTIALAAVVGAGLLVQQGGKIYRSGSESLVYPGESNMGIPSSALPCASCHGVGAAGGREGGVTAPRIDALSLTAPTPLRPAYDLQTFEGAVRDGVGPGGRRFNPVMPRYKLTGHELRALWAHLGDVAVQQRLGVAPKEVRFGILVGPADEERGRALAQMAQQAWAEKASPIFGRKAQFELIVADDNSAHSAARKAAAADILALVFLADPKGDLHAALTDEAVPSIFPLTALQGTETARLTVGLFASRADQIRALIHAAGPDAVILADQEGRDFLEETGLQGQVRPGMIDRVRSLNGKAVVVAGAEGMRRLAAVDLSRASLFGISDEMAFAMPQLLAAGASVTLADARAPSATSERRRPDVLRFMGAAVALLEEGLVRSGRDVTRTRLLAAIRSASVSPPEWPLLDYRKHALTGTTSVALRTIRSNGAARR